MKSTILSQCCIYLPWIQCQNIFQIENKYYTHIVAVLRIFTQYYKNVSEIRRL